MCLTLKYVCQSCRHPISNAGMDEGEACSLSLTVTENMTHDDKYREIHSRLLFHEVIPLPYQKAVATGFICRNMGCAYNPETPTAEGQEGTFRDLARCPGCDHIISTETNLDLEGHEASALYRFLGHRAHVQIPVLSRKRWATWFCNYPQNGCLWSRQMMESTQSRLEAIRKYMSIIPLSDAMVPADAPRQQLELLAGPVVPAHDRRGRAWTESEEVTLKRMRAAGATYREIGEVLGKTTSTVKSKWLFNEKRDREADTLERLRRTGLAPPSASPN
ncbi:hypothetical protein CPLU01_09136 [Colletotrichum plurivorum]|uniref:Uncharacterized protein n=1 Tax=Colletotrichum plurivorum TaxID=2175906 RepID=A0A8H6K9N6_9PEZI|nr:hypothetical protein CPLU01_09136 [Colletotrichum plurivorum]